MKASLHVPLPGIGRFMAGAVRRVASLAAMLACGSFAWAAALPIPTLETGTIEDGVRVFRLTMQNGFTQFNPGMMTPTSGYNGSYLGPVLALRTGERVRIHVTNNLGMNTTTHWHGLHIPPVMDGGPHQPIANGETWSPEFEILNTASTCWFHPHFHPVSHSGGHSGPSAESTGAQVHRGLAGLLYIHDTVSDSLSLPKTYGVDDIPLIVQDRGFLPNGSFLEFPDPTDVPPLRKGETILVNGGIIPTFSAPAQMVRLRLLDASNSRIYNFGFSDGRSFHQIASDNGFLEAPVATNRLRLSPGERAEIVVDFSGQVGSSVRLISYASELEGLVPPGVQDPLDLTNYDIMTFSVTAPTVNPTPVTSLPTRLTSIERISESEASNAGNPRRFTLGADNASIDGAAFDIDHVNETVAYGSTEIWEFTNEANIAHPVHIHGEPYQILSRSTGSVPANERGWKDTALVAPGETLRLIRRFGDFADPDSPFMYHCHILEHEDHGMMGQFVIVQGADGWAFR